MDTLKISGYCAEVNFQQKKVKTKRQTFTPAIAQHDLQIDEQIISKISKFLYQLHFTRTSQLSEYKKHSYNRRLQWSRKFVLTSDL